MIAVIIMSVVIIITIIINITIIIIVVVINITIIMIIPSCYISCHINMINISLCKFKCLPTIWAPIITLGALKPSVIL